MRTGLEPYPVPSVPDVPIWQLTVEDYHTMIKMRIIGEDDPVELLEGWLVQQERKTPQHSYATNATSDLLRTLMIDGFFVTTHALITMIDSEPEPDVMVVRGSIRSFYEHHPYPENVPLVIEIAHEGLFIDQTIRKRVYARSGIPIYWIVNLNESQIEVYSLPVSDGMESRYQVQTIYLSGDEIPVVIDGQEIARIAVSDLLAKL